MARHDNGIYYFLGTITSHVLHALPLHKVLGGTFVVTSKNAAETLKEYGVPVVCLDDIPHILKWQGRRPHRITHYTALDKRFTKTADYLNSHAKVVLFYELFDIASELTLTTPKKIFLTHGNMLKNYFKMHPRRLEIIKQYDYMAALGPFMKQEFIRSGIDQKKLVEIGIARTDEVTALAKKVAVSDILTRAGVPSTKPIVSYLPTFWGDSSVESLGVKLLENIPDSYTMLFRPHPQTPSKILKHYKQVLARKNIFYLPEDGPTSPSLLDIYAASSVIVGDVSSVMLEAILLDRPLIFMSPDTKTNIEPHDQLRTIREFSELISDSNVSEVDTALATSIKRGIDLQTWSDSKDNAFFHHDGTSVKSIAVFVRQLL